MNVGMYGPSKRNMIPGSNPTSNDTLNYPMLVDVVSRLSKKKKKKKKKRI